MNGKRIFLTGHTGFKGSWLAFWLNNLHSNVSGLSLEPEKDSHWNDLDISIQNNNIGDIRNYNFVEEVDFIFFVCLIHSFVRNNDIFSIQIHCTLIEFLVITY